MCKMVFIPHIFLSSESPNLLFSVLSLKTASHLCCMESTDVWLKVRQAQYSSTKILSHDFAVLGITGTAIWLSKLYPEKCFTSLSRGVNRLPAKQRENFPNLKLYKFTSHIPREACKSLISYCCERSTRIKFKMLPGRLETRHLNVDWPP